MRAKEEDEELFRDLFAGDNDAELNDEADGRTAARPCFLPQKPVAKRTPATTSNPNPRKYLTPMKPSPPQPVLSPPFIPRLKLEELVNTRPDDNDDNESNNILRLVSRRSSELEQVTEEDEVCSDDEVSNAKDSLPTHDHGCINSSRFPRNNQKSNNNSNLEQETQRFLEKLDLRAVLHTPRPDLLNFYPCMTVIPSVNSSDCPHFKISGLPSKHSENCYAENSSVFEQNWVAPAKEKDDITGKDPPKATKTDGVASRLAHMESTYGIAPIVRKTRRETIDRLANPISGHSSTLQALSPKQRKKREAALTSRAPMSPISSAIAVSCRRGCALKKGKTKRRIGDRGGRSETPASQLVSLKYKPAKRPDPLIHKRRSTSSDQAIDGSNRRKGKTSVRSCTLAARKEALKKKLQCRPDVTKRGNDRKIGGATFLTQRDDEEGIELIEDFIARNRGAAQASLTFRSGKKTPLPQVVPAISTRNATTARSRPQPPQVRAGMAFACTSGITKSTLKGRGTHTSRDPVSLGNLTERKNVRYRSGGEHELTKFYQQPKRPQAWQQSSSTVANTFGYHGRPTNSGGAVNPLRKLKVHPAIPALVSRPPKISPSTATTVLMGPALLLSPTQSTDTKAASTRRTKKAVLAQKPSNSRSKRSTATFDAPTKVSAQRRRTSTSAVDHDSTFKKTVRGLFNRLSGGEIASRHTAVARRFTSRV
ncbi:unnamed protein product [Phytophthora lilii]|uniref:Unnamed protein product n=1 Tax=Phytophthora lilii TaxID=2077276 RepID=A0A9W7DCS2_9STRA|nr:unnamed protein product [Phytophthora lilii]